ncbi:type II toxin-antitoxin system Phd/YefM family antitoxin [uncultured Meiothermus sp.]|jgi:prevent-host-death family protein|uniref:type II toxin-antitoxin system Phd/YefM family antitoxin n=1 Tax=uncultured Meiothermus sp. TaxID=157471 RepID=UPI002615DD81|nr:type II toxin-antitoxin system Phd/YefM family antitoxin [uncultured Meiothermus sp.]
MPRPLLDEDIRPLSEFRSNSASLIERVRKTKRPLVLTQHGRSAAVVLDVGEYERLMEKLEILQELHTSLQQIAEGNGMDSQTARKQVLQRLGR